MWQTALNTVGTAALAALVAVVAAAIKAFGDAEINLINEKAAAVKAKAGADKWNFWLTIAKQQWGAVDEEFRITPTLEKTIANKQALFAEKIKQAIPGITDEQIEQLRQAVAGEVNKGKVAIVGQIEDTQGNGLAADGKVTAPADPTAQTSTGRKCSGSDISDSAITILNSINRLKSYRIDFRYGFFVYHEIIMQDMSGFS